MVCEMKTLKKFVIILYACLLTCILNINIKFVIILMYSEYAVNSEVKLENNEDLFKVFSGYLIYLTSHKFLTFDFF